MKKRMKEDEEINAKPAARNCAILGFISRKDLLIIKIQSSYHPYLISLTMLVLGAVWLQDHYQITEDAQYCRKMKDECWQLNDNEKYNMRDVAMVSCSVIRDQ